MSAALLLESCVGMYPDFHDRLPMDKETGSDSHANQAGRADSAGRHAPDSMQALEMGSAGRKAPMAAHDAGSTAGPASHPSATQPPSEPTAPAANSGSGGGGDTLRDVPRVAGSAAAGRGAGAGGTHTAVAGEGSEPDPITLPPLTGAFDYQIAKAYPPPASVAVVIRDHKQAPAEGSYNICEMSGFRAREEDRELWLTEHPDLVLRDTRGVPVFDPYASMLIDVSTQAKREELARVIGDWIASCASAGFDAIAINDLDAYSVSGGRLQAQDVLDAMQSFSAIAHAHGLAIGQTNASELARQKAAIGTDFAVAEQCNRYQECDEYRATYGDKVLVVEYRRSDFDAGCNSYPQLPIVLRDSALASPGDEGYVYESC
jgi:hypothetical protein